MQHHNIKRYSTNILLVFLLGKLCNVQALELMFNSGFQPNSHMVTTPNSVGSIFVSGFEDYLINASSRVDIEGADNSVSAPNDWQDDFDRHPNIGNFSIFYEGGDSTMRYAKIVEEPDNSSNKVLHFWLKDANVGGYKGRVQAGICGNNDIYEISQKVRMFLPNDWNIIKNSNDITVSWMTIMEFWNNPGWIGDEHPFRISLGMHKTDPGSNRLTFNLKADVKPDMWWVEIWEEHNSDFSIPVNQWMTVELYFKEGNATNGRFVLAVTPDNGMRQIIFDVTNFTHHPDDNNPDGLSCYNPMKLYTSGATVDYVRNRNGVLQVYWDDFELWKDGNIIF